MDIEYLRDFLALARDMNFTRTAGRLNISQPALSKRIAAVEREFGVRVFDRSNLGTSLTPAGRMMLEEAQAIVEAYDSGRERMRAYAASAPMRLRLLLFRGYKPTDDLLVTVLERFRREGRVIEVDAADVVKPPLEQIRKGEADMGLLVHPKAADLTGLVSVPLVTEPLVAVVHRDHPLAAKDVLDVSDLDGNVVWTIREGGSLQFALEVEETIAALGGHPNFVARPWANGQSSYTAIAFVDSGIHVTFGSVAKFSMPITSTDHKVLRFSDERMATTVSAVWRADDPNPACNLLASAMCDVVNRTDMSAYWR